MGTPTLACLSFSTEVSVYNDQDLFVIDEFFSIDHIAQHFNWLVSPKLLIEAVNKLRPLTHSKNSDPKAVIAALNTLYETIGPKLFLAALSSGVWEEWCPLDEDACPDVDPPADAEYLWAGSNGIVTWRTVNDGGSTELVFHAQPAKGE